MIRVHDRLRKLEVTRPQGRQVGVSIRMYDNPTEAFVVRVVSVLFEDHPVFTEDDERELDAQIHAAYGPAFTGSYFDQWAQSPGAPNDSMA